MSLAIDVDTITGVLLSDGSVHTVADQSFDLDSFEFVSEGETIHGGGNSGVCATGFVFKTKKDRILAGPLTAIVAVIRRP